MLVLSLFAAATPVFAATEAPPITAIVVTEEPNRALSLSCDTKDGRTIQIADPGRNDYEVYSIIEKTMTREDRAKADPKVFDDITAKVMGTKREALYFGGRLDECDTFRGYVVDIPYGQNGYEADNARYHEVYASLGLDPDEVRYKADRLVMDHAEGVYDGNGIWDEVVTARAMRKVLGDDMYARLRYALDPTIGLGAKTTGYPDALENGNGVYIESDFGGATVTVYVGRQAAEDEIRRRGAMKVYKFNSQHAWEQYGAAYFTFVDGTLKSIGIGL